MLFVPASPAGAASPEGAALSNVDQFLTGAVRSSDGRLMRSFVLTSTSSRMIVAHDVLEPRCSRDRVRGETAGDDSRLDTARVDAALRPIPGDREVVACRVQGRDAILAAAGKRKRVAIGRVHVRRPELRRETAFTGRVACADRGDGRRQEVPAELAGFIDCARPEMLGLAPQ